MKLSYCSWFSIKNESSKALTNPLWISGMSGSFKCLLFSWHLPFQISWVTTNKRKQLSVGHRCQIVFPFLLCWIDSEASAPPQCNSWCLSPISESLRLGKSHRLGKEEALSACLNSGFDPVKDHVKFVLTLNYALMISRAPLLFGAIGRYWMTHYYIPLSYTSMVL